MSLHGQESICRNDCFETIEHTCEKLRHGLIRIESLSGINREDLTFAVITVILLLVGTGLLSKAKKLEEYFKPNYAWCFVLGSVFATAFVCLNNAGEFLYFNF